VDKKDQPIGFRIPTWMLIATVLGLAFMLAMAGILLFVLL
jgi:hypothetical protein